ncbi:MAG: LysE family transporter [Pseudomonadota bacterium]
MDINIWLAFVAASTALLMVPGPTVLLVMGYALGAGRRVAVPTALGVALGDLVAISAALVGLGAVALASATAFLVLKWAGAAYLVWLGIRMIRSAGRSHADAPAAARGLSPLEACRNAAMVTVLNPKSIGFFVAFLPQFIDPARPLAMQAVILTVTFVALGAMNALAYAFLAARLRLVIGAPAVIPWLTRAGGGALITMGIITASFRRASA